MDSLINAAAIALASGDALGALKRVALREDAAALALRGVAMAQLGDLERAKAALHKAVRAFGAREIVARARCMVAEAEIALVSRELTLPTKALDQARITLEQHGDRLNAAHARNIEARRLLLIGSVNEAERVLGASTESLPPHLTAGRELIVAGIAIRRLDVRAARTALQRADRAAAAAGILGLNTEIKHTWEVLGQPAARLMSAGEYRQIDLEEIATVVSSGALVVDACRHVTRQVDAVISFTTRPVLFNLARSLAEAWPGDVRREMLIERAFRTRAPDETHRARLRVEIGRLRAELEPLAKIVATPRGFQLQPLEARQVLVLAPPFEHAHAPLLALLADGAAWSSSALALALGASPRTVQRALEELSKERRAQSFGRGRAQRWTIPSVPGFPTTLLLPGVLSAG